MASSSASIPPPSPPTASVRLATISDHQTMSTVFAAAFFEDVLFGQLIHPHRNAYPQDCALYWLRRIQHYWWDWTHVFVVATTTVAEVNESSVTAGNLETMKREKITGVAHWSRGGPPQPSMARSDGVGMPLASYSPLKLIGPVADMLIGVLSKIYPNRAADPEKESCVEQSYPFSARYFDDPKRMPCWSLEHLAVNPEHQGEGIGKLLVEWGFRRADEEGCMASVVSANTAERFYEKLGFEWEGQRASDGEGNPLKDVPGGRLYWRSPSSALK